MGLTKTVALETAGSGVTCNCINPGWVYTPLVAKQIEARAKSQNISIEAARVDLLAEKQPSKEFVEIDAIAEAVLFYCSEAGRNITGIAMPIDGAWTAQ
jgi:3-hydroxybutyrate dehydrogenase